MKSAASLLACCALVLGSCSTTAPPKPVNVELVMRPGMVIAAKTAAGAVAITATSTLQRTYSWEGASRSADLEPRIERWYGSLGAYFPGSGKHWREHNGITRGVLEEGQQHFLSQTQARDWLLEQADNNPTVYRDDGLVVSFGKVPERRQINVEVWQIFIRGKQPVRLPGSNNRAIRVLKN